MQVDSTNPQIEECTALIVGVGGLGAPVALGLAEAGVGCLRLIDPDHVDLTNLQRQVLFTTNDLGQPKVTVAQRSLEKRFPELQIESVQGRLTHESAARIIAGCDVVIDASDDPEVGFIINDESLRQDVPAVLGGVARFEGLVLGVATGCGPCYRCLFEEAPSQDEGASCAQAGVVGAMAGIIGHLQVKRALGFLNSEHAAHTGFVTTVDGLAGRVRRVLLPTRSQCKHCGGLERRIDITGELCPMTYVRTRLALEQLSPGDVMEITMRRGEPARNVPRSLRDEGHEVSCSGPIDEDLYRVVVRHGAPARAAEAQLGTHENRN